MTPLDKAEESTRRLVYNLAHVVGSRTYFVNYFHALAVVKNGAPASALAGLCWQPYGEA